MHDLLREKQCGTAHCYITQLVPSLLKFLLDEREIILVCESRKFLRQGTSPLQFRISLLLLGGHETFDLLKTGTEYVGSHGWVVKQFGRPRSPRSTGFDGDL